MPVFSITEDDRLTVTEDTQANKKTRVCAGLFRLTRDLELKPYGVIKRGALATSDVYEDGVLALVFVEHWKALRQWDNILLLFPDCVDSEILEALEAVTEDANDKLVSLWKVAATFVALCM